MTILFTPKKLNVPLGIHKKVVLNDGKYIGRFTWKDCGNFADIGYCFVKGKGREYLKNYRLMRDAVIEDIREKGLKRIVLPFRKIAPEKISFLKYLLRPIDRYHENEDFIYFVKEIGG